MNFSGKTALVTGAAVGIGRGVALELGRMGANLILLDVNSEKLESLKNELSSISGKVLTYICDVSDEETVKNTVADAISKLGTVHILVNNAALWRMMKPFLETDISEWNKFIEVNVMGTVYVTRAVLPGMLEKGYGRIINVSSVAGVYGNANMTCYSATKAAVNAFTKALAKEVTDKGILVNAVCPGSVSPAENDDIDYVEPSNLAFIGRTGSDRENANLICFLASDEASYISGQNIQIDGCRKKQ